MIDGSAELEIVTVCTVTAAQIDGADAVDEYPDVIVAREIQSFIVAAVFKVCLDVRGKVEIPIGVTAHFVTITAIAEWEESVTAELVGAVGGICAREFEVFPERHVDAGDIAVPHIKRILGELGGGGIIEYRQTVVTELVFDHILFVSILAFEVWMSVTRSKIAAVQSHVTAVDASINWVSWRCSGACCRIGVGPEVSVNSGQQDSFGIILRVFGALETFFVFAVCGATVTRSGIAVVAFFAGFPNGDAVAADRLARTIGAA